MSSTETSDDQGKPREGFPFELNGEKLFAPAEKMRPPEIIEIAWEMKILPFEPDKYVLASPKDGTVYKAEDYVNLAQDNDFIAQPTTPGTVAQEPPYVIVA